MASFAKLNSENIVEQVISIHNNELLDNGIESEQKGIEFCKFLYGQDTIWKQTSYNTKGGIHLLGGTPFRKNHAGIGYIYDEQRDAFISPKPFNSWILEESTCTWNPPITKPDTSPEDNFIYIWNESIVNWEKKYS
jgi:hypothetical protein